MAPPHAPVDEAPAQDQKSPEQAPAKGDGTGMTDVRCPAGQTCKTIRVPAGVPAPATSVVGVCGA